MNKSRLKLAVKFICFTLTTIFCVFTVNSVLKPKYYYNETWSTTNTYEDFYNLKKNSVDVLFFGSSHAICSFNPQVIYDEYGITSYNMGSEQQSLVVSYYWLREALKYQNPKVVVLETLTFHQYKDAYVYNNMNCSEGSVRKAMDSMRLSSLKFEAGMAIEAEDPTQSGLSFPFLNIRYHSRWAQLDENDFTEPSMVNHGGIKGFTAGTPPKDLTVADTYTPFKDEDITDVKAEPMVKIAEPYLNKIIDLCEQEDIQLIFVNIPTAETIARYKSTKEFAEKHNVPFYDFNEEKLYKEIRYNLAVDRSGHPSYLGAEKISLYMGKVLSREYGVQPREDSSYDISRELYKHKIENMILAQTTDLNTYLERINNSKYSIFIFAPTEYSKYIDDEIMNKLRALGFTTDLQGIADGIHYCAVKDSEGITEKLTSDDLSFSGSIRNGASTYGFVINTTMMMKRDHKYSMIVAGTECGDSEPGLHVVVYDNELKMIIDKTRFNTGEENQIGVKY